MGWFMVTGAFASVSGERWPDVDKKGTGLPKANSISRRDKELERKQDIMDSAAECFMLRGYYATTIDQIAEQNGSTKGLIYYHFASKTDLFFAVYELAMRRTIDRSTPFLSVSGTGAEKLRLLCENHIVAMMRNLPYHHVAKQGVERHLLSALTSDQQKTLRCLFKLRDEYENSFATVIEEGTKDGSLVCDSARLAARTILGSLNGVSVWYRPRSAETQAQREELAQRITNIIIQGVRRGPLRPVS